MKQLLLRLLFRLVALGRKPRPKAAAPDSYWLPKETSHDPYGCL